jgi:hypothetical protein
MKAAGDYGPGSREDGVLRLKDRKIDLEISSESSAQTSAFRASEFN